MSRHLVLISAARSDPARVARPQDTVAAYRRFFLPAGRRLAEPDRLGCCRGPGLAPGAPRGGEPLLAARTAGTGSPRPASPGAPAAAASWESSSSGWAAVARPRASVVSGARPATPPVPGLTARRAAR